MFSPSKIDIPSSIGHLALDELDHVPWAELAHAYGTGKLGPELYEDVAGTLRQLGESRPRAFEEAVHALSSNLCHQGTIYQATAFAVPFLAAIAAGADRTPNQVVAFVAVFASIGIAASFEAPSGSPAGSWGPGVARLTREALHSSSDLLSTVRRAIRRRIRATDGHPLTCLDRPPATPGRSRPRARRRGPLHPRGRDRRGIARAGSCLRVDPIASRS